MFKYHRSETSFQDSRRQTTELQSHLQARHDQLHLHIVNTDAQIWIGDPETRQDDVRNSFGRRKQGEIAEPNLETR